MSEKSTTFFDALRRAEPQLKALEKSWPAGCTYNKWDETRIGAGGQLQKRTCRSVTGCEDPAYNHGTICEGWEDA